MARSDHDPRSPKLVEYLSFVLDNFSDPQTVPGDLYLNYRLPGYVVEERHIFPDQDAQQVTTVVVKSISPIDESV